MKNFETVTSNFALEELIIDVRGEFTAYIDKEALCIVFLMECLLYNKITKNCRPKWRKLHLQIGEKCRGIWLVPGTV